MASINQLPHCSVCKRTLKYGCHAPFLLPCLHTVCSDCLEHVGTTLTCTHCSETHSKQDHIFLKDAVTAAAIVTSTARNSPSEIKCTNKKHGVMAEIWCRDCQVFYCKSCLASHNQMKMARSHDTVRVKSLIPGESLKLTSLCPEHETQPLDLYDITCEILVCSKCTRAEHKQCTCEDIEGSTLENAKEVLLDNKKHVKERLQEVKTATDLLVENSSEAYSRQEIMKTKLKSQFESLITVLDKREQELVEELDGLGCSRLESISRVLDVMREKLESVRDYTTQLSALGDSAELLTLASSVCSRTEDCLAEDIPNFRIPRVQVTFDEEQIEELTNKLSSFGSVGREETGRTRARKKRSDYENLEIKQLPDKDEADVDGTDVDGTNVNGTDEDGTDVKDTDRPGSMNVNGTDEDGTDVKDTDRPGSMNVNGTDEDGTDVKDTDRPGSMVRKVSLCGSSEDESQCGEYTMLEEVQSDASGDDSHL